MKLYFYFLIFTRISTGYSEDEKKMVTFIDLFINQFYTEISSGDKTWFVFNKTEFAELPKEKQANGWI